MVLQTLQDAAQEPTRQVCRLIVVIFSVVGLFDLRLAFSAFVATEKVVQAYFVATAVGEELESAAKAEMPEISSLF